jgi:hypothetical protein
MNWTERLTPAADRMKDEWALLDGVVLGCQNGSVVEPLDPRAFANGDFVSVRAALNISIRSIYRRKVVTTTFQPKQVIRLATETMLKQIGVVKAPVNEAKRYKPYASNDRKRARIAAIDIDADLMTPEDKVENRSTNASSRVDDQQGFGDKEMTSIE